jgi:hypothetical protein
VRAPAAGVVSCAIARDAETVRREIASIREENILNFGIAINYFLLIVGSGKLTTSEPESF